MARRVPDPPNVTNIVVEEALLLGYRHDDTAADDGNELEFGDAVRRSGMDRAEVFVEPKLWVSDYG